jgi:hypothetical protein
MTVLPTHHPKSQKRILMLNTGDYTKVALPVPAGRKEVAMELIDYRLRLLAQTGLFMGGEDSVHNAGHSVD